MSSNAIISVSPASLAKFNKDMNKYSKESQKGVKNEVQRATLNIHREAQINVNKDDKKGTRHAVRAGITKRFFNKGFSGEVKSTHKAAVFIEDGARPHTIVPRTAPYLVFKVKSNGFTKWVRTKLVNHPGMKAEPYLKPAADREIPRFIRRLKKVL